MSKPFDLLVFDWDGTLADSTTVIAEALQRACRDVGCAVPDDVDARYVIGLGLSDALRHIAPDLPAAEHPRLSARYRDHYLSREPAIPLFEGARELLCDLHSAGFRLAVATGKSRVGLDRALLFHRLVPLFAATRCADEGRPKPHPDMLHFLMEHVGVGAPRTLMIGDTTHDLQMAAKAGVGSVAMAHGAHAAASLATEGPLAIAGSLRDLRAWLEDGARDP
jgi:phosphoglycolate phosphatase